MKASEPVLRPRTVLVERVPPTTPSGQPGTSDFAAPCAGQPEPLGVSMSRVRPTKDPQALESDLLSWKHWHHTLGIRSLTFEPLICQDGRANFALFTSGATAVTLCLFTEADMSAGRTTHEIELDPESNRTGDVWHVMLPRVDTRLLYGIRRPKGLI